MLPLVFDSDWSSVLEPIDPCHNIEVLLVADDVWYRLPTKQSRSYLEASPRKRYGLSEDQRKLF
jgi:hypothetical protein